MNSRYPMAIWRRLRLELTWLSNSRERWLEQVGAHQWVFVAGSNRSGKTTLSNLFRNHPEVSVIPNANMHTRALPESSREGCPHIWTEKLERFRLTESDTCLPASRLVFDWLHYYEHSARFIMLESDLPAVQMRWLQEVFPGASLIGVVRNGYAVAEGLRLKEGYSIERCARQWNLVTKIMLEDTPYIRRFHLVRYEEFVEYPRKVVSDLCGFLGLDPVPLMPFLESGWRLGNLDRKSSSLRNANADLIDRLSPDDIETIAYYASEMLEYFCYADGHRSLVEK